MEVWTTLHATGANMLSFIYSMVLVPDLRHLPHVSFHINLHTLARNATFQQVSATVLAALLAAWILYSFCLQVAAARSLIQEEEWRQRLAYAR